MLLTELPSELLLAIADQLRNGNVETTQEYHDGNNFPGLSAACDILRLSSTSAFLRSLLRPYIHETVALRNSNQHGIAIRRIASTAYGRNVKHFHFIGSVPGARGDDSNVQSYNDVEEVMPDIVWDIIAGLNCFPNLQSLTVSFDPVLPDPTSSLSGYNMFAIETDSEVLDAEDNNSLRALMASTWEGISQNKSPHFKTFNIYRLEPIKASTFSSPAFHRFLSNLEHFSLSMSGQRVDTLGSRRNEFRGLVPFYSRLDRFFFDHLTRTESFTLIADREHYLGHGVSDYALPLQLHDYHFPHLKSVHLEHMILCPSLLEFLGERMATLRDVDLVHCAGNVKGFTDSEDDAASDDDDDISWSHLFNHLADTEPAYLRKLVVLPASYRQKFSQEKDYSRRPAAGSLPKAEIGHVNATLEPTAERDRIWFVYKTFDSNGHLIDNLRQIGRAFIEGEDQKAYDRLMLIVQSNNGK